MQEIKKRGMPLELALLPMIESNYNPNQVSPAKAAGLWQLMPTTARGLGVLINWWYDGRRDIITSTHVALDYLQYLHDNFNSWPLAFSAYNAGMGTVSKAIHYNKVRGRATNFWSLRLPQQTRSYVPKLIAIAIILSHPERYHIPVKKVFNRPYFTRVTVNFPISFYQLAKFAHTSIYNIRRLNPGFKRQKLSPRKSYNLLIPNSRIGHFKQNLTNYLAKTTTLQRAKHLYTVKNGDTLSTIAAKHKVTTASLRNNNHLNSDLIRIGQALYIPTA